MSYLIYVAFFGAAAVIFLWLRDARIFFRTGLSGYRKAAYRGVLYGALSTFGVLCTLAGESIEIFGLALIVAALYLQGRMTREKIWTGHESTLERALGSVKRPTTNKK
ncbi:MAG: ABC transporter permease [Methanoregula sp.]|jgi:hypothetical protein